MRQRIWRAAVGVALGLLPAVAPRGALAKGPQNAQGAQKVEQDTNARAEDLFKRGQELLNEGRFARACPMLEESQRVDPAIGTQFNLAECYAKTKRGAKAHRLFLDVAVEAKKTRQPEREQLARERAAEIAAELGLIRIRVPVSTASQETFLLSVDDEEVTPSLSSKNATLLDLGAHEVVATAKGKRPYRRTIMLEEPGKVVEVSIPELEDVAGSSPTRRSPVWSTGRYVSAAWGAASASLFVAGSVVLMTERQKIEPQRLANATALMAVGGTGLVSAVVLWWFTPPREPSPASVGLRVAPVITPGHGGVFLSGHF